MFYGVIAQGDHLTATSGAIVCHNPVGVVLLSPRVPRVGPRRANPGLEDAAPLGQRKVRLFDSNGLHLLFLDSRWRTSSDSVCWRNDLQRLSQRGSRARSTRAYRPRFARKRGGRSALWPVTRSGVQWVKILLGRNLSPGLSPLVSSQGEGGRCVIPGLR